MDNLKDLLPLLEKKLEELDENRKKVQGELQEIYTYLREEVGTFEENNSDAISKSFEETEERIFGIIEKLNEGDISGPILEGAQKELLVEQKFEFQDSDSAESFSDSYTLNISEFPVPKRRRLNNANNEEEIENGTDSLVSQLEDHLEKTRESMTAAQDKLTEICNERRNKVEDLKVRIIGKVEVFFKEEDARTQEVMKMVRENIDKESTEELRKLITKAKILVIVNKKFELVRPSNESLLEDYDIIATNEGALNYIHFQERKPEIIAPSFTKEGDISISYRFFNEEEDSILSPFELASTVTLMFWEKDCDESTAKTVKKKWTLGNKDQIVFSGPFELNTPYCLKIKVKHCTLSTQWSDHVEFTTSKYCEHCVWKECPDYVEEGNKYSVDEKNPRIATKTDGDWLNSCTIIGNTHLPPNKVTSWSVKILKSMDNDGGNIWVGVAPSDINQDECNYYKCGWYFYCLSSTLRSGPPHNYERKEYGLRKWHNWYTSVGSIVGVVMDTVKGELSFTLDGVNLGVAYEGIPLDKPLVPCVLIRNKGDSVELVPNEVKEFEVNRSIPVPSNILIKNSTWGSIILTWNSVWWTSFYQIEVDGSKFLEASSKNTFTKKELFPDREYTFRVRAVKGNSVSEWSDPVKGRTQFPLFSKSVWKESPYILNSFHTYQLNLFNSRVATNSYDLMGTVIGDTALPPNQVTLWSIKILKSRKNNGSCIYIGVAPFDIRQDSIIEFLDKDGWYFHCYDSTLCSGPPHNYKDKEYGQRKEEGQYTRTGDSVGVVMDTAKGDLSFVLNGVNLGVAYEGIPLDKPLVPCVLLENKGDSVELII